MKKEEYFTILNNVYKEYLTYRYTKNFHSDTLKYIGMLSGVVECAFYDEDIKTIDYCNIIEKKTNFINLILYN